MYYVTAGTGEPVVLLHGLAEDHRSWSKVQSMLATRSTYAVDLRRHGQTPVGDGDGTLAQLGGDLIGSLDAVTGPAPVVGFSLGGTVALWAAAERPDLVPHVVAVATSSVVGGAAVEFFTGRIAQLEAGDFAGFAAGLRDDTSKQVDTGVDLDELTARRVAAVGGGAGYTNAARAMMALRAKPLTPKLAFVSVHVDVVGADGDVFCPRKAADIIVDALPDATYHEIANCGHLVTLDQPKIFGELLSGPST